MEGVRKVNRKLKKYYIDLYKEGDDVSRFNLMIGFEQLRKDLEEVFGITVDTAELMSNFDIEEFMQLHGEEIKEMFINEINSK